MLRGGASNAGAAATLQLHGQEHPAAPRLANGRHVSAGAQCCTVNKCEQPCSAPVAARMRESVCACATVHAASAEPAGPQPVLPTPLADGTMAFKRFSKSVHMSSVCRAPHALVSKKQIMQHCHDKCNTRALVREGRTTLRICSSSAFSTLSSSTYARCAAGPAPRQHTAEGCTCCTISFIETNARSGCARSSQDEQCTVRWSLLRLLL